MKHRYFTLARLVAARPANAPDGLLIVNAYVPLHGEQHWMGPFEHGNFYAAIREDDDVAIEAAYQAQAWVISYLSLDEALVELDAFAVVRDQTLEQYCFQQRLSLDRNNPESVRTLFGQLVKFKYVYL